MGAIMKKLILITLIAFSFGVPPRSSISLDWLKGNHNPNGKTGMVSIRTPIFDKLNYTEYYESDLVVYTIPLTDFITWQYSIESIRLRPDGFGSGSYWGEESTIRNRELYLHLPLYKLWE